MVGIPSGVGFTHASAVAWALTDTWDAPTTTENLATCGSAVSNVVPCTFASDLAANTAYGLRFTGAATSAVGQFAPVTM